jgi:hypothetical protein
MQTFHCEVDLKRIFSGTKNIFFLEARFNKENRTQKSEPEKGQGCSLVAECMPSMRKAPTPEPGRQKVKKST